MEKRLNIERILKLLTLCVTIGVLSCNDVAERNHTEVETNIKLIFPKGEKITNDNFTGTVYLHSLIEDDSINTNSIGNVTFEPGARSKWHMHPAGQILLATDGVGYYQEKGQLKKILRKGDVIKCPPNIPHWHGASSDTAFVQVAITGREKGPTVWLESVTDEEYNK
jgi:quercetin dioxygenase-like cupin family protein